MTTDGLLIIPETRDIRLVDKDHEIFVVAWLLRKIHGLPQLSPMAFHTDPEGKPVIVPVEMKKDSFELKVNGEIIGKEEFIVLDHV